MIIMDTWPDAMAPKIMSLGRMTLFSQCTPFITSSTINENIHIFPERPGNYHERSIVVSTARWSPD
jgi:hypothetical protein